MLFFLSFFFKEANAAQTMFTPLFLKVQTFAELIFFMSLIVITSYFNLLLSGKNKLKALYLFIHRYCSRFTYPWGWFSVSNCKHYKMYFF